MSNLLWRRCLIIFHMVVWTVTIMAVSYCLKVYYLDEDLCIIEYKKYYEQKSDGFPKLSVCFRDPISESKLKEQDPDVSKTMYLKYLTGDYYNETYSKIDYFDVVLDMANHVLEYEIDWRNGDRNYYKDYHDETKKLFTATYAFIWETHFFQCYELQVPEDKNINSLFAVVNSSLFPPRDEVLNYNLLTFLHYPNQLLISGKNVKFAWPQRETNDDFIMRFRVDGIEVLKIREKTGRSCNDMEDYDASVILNHAQRIGCKAPYHRVLRKYQDRKLNFGLEVCSTKELMKNVSLSLKKRDETLVPPCSSMKKIDYHYEESSMKGTKFSRKGYLWIGLYFHDDQFKEISQTR